MPFKRIPLTRDLFERVVSTFVIGASSVALADGMNLIDVLNLDLWKAAAAAGVAAVLSLVKGLIASAFGGGASLDPGVKLEPVTAAPTHA